MKKKYFKWFEEDEATRGLPNREKKFHYTGAYYQISWENGSRSRMKAWLAAAALALPLLMVTSGLINQEGARTVYVILPYVLAWFPLVYLEQGVWSLLTQKQERMTLPQYEESYLRISHSFFGSFVLTVAALFGEGVYSVIHWNTMADPVRELLFLALMAVCAVILFGIHLLLQKYPCRELS